MALIPGIPDDFACLKVLAVFPWYDRPALSLVSKVWQQQLQGLGPGVLPRVNLEGRLLMQSKEEQRLLMQDAEGWRTLPPPPVELMTSLRLSLKLPDTLMVKTALSGGIIFIWVQEFAEVFKLDLCRGSIKWERVVNCPIPSWTSPVAFHGSIYGLLPGSTGLQKFDVQTGSLSVISTPPDLGLYNVWWAGDEQHLHGFCSSPAPDGSIVEFDPETLAWNRVLEVRGALLANQGHREDVSFETVEKVWIGESQRELIHYDAHTRQWTPLVVEAPVEGCSYALYASSGGSLYAQTRDKALKSLWKARIDFSSQSVTWVLLYTFHSSFRVVFEPSVTGITTDA